MNVFERATRRLRDEWAALLRGLALVGWRRVTGNPPRPGVTVRRPSRDA